MKHNITNIIIKTLQLLIYKQNYRSITKIDKMQSVNYNDVKQLIMTRIKVVKLSKASQKFNISVILSNIIINSNHYILTHIMKINV